MHGSFDVSQELGDLKDIYTLVLLRTTQGVVCLVVLCHVIKFLGDPLRDLCRQPSFRNACADVVRSVGCFLGIMQAPAGALEAAVRDQIDEFRLRHALACITIAAHVNAVVIFGRLVNFEFNDHVEEGLVALRLMWHGVLYIGLFIFACGWVALTVRRLDVLYVVCVCSYVVTLLQIEDDPAFVLVNGARVLFRVMSGIVYLDYQKTMWYNLALSVVTCWRFAYNDSAILRLHGEQTNMIVFCSAEAITCLFLVAGLYCVEKWLEARVRVQIVAENQKQASLKLLSYQCQAVFWLTPDLRIDGPAPQLADMLLINAAPDQMAGREFERYVAQDGDRQRFRDFIETSKVCQGLNGPPSVVHMNLRDAYSTNVPVDVFHVHSVDIDSRESHLIGLREGVAREPQPEQDEQAQRPVRRGLGLPVLAPPAAASETQAEQDEQARRPLHAGVGLLVPGPPAAGGETQAEQDEQAQRPLHAGLGLPGPVAPALSDSVVAGSGAGVGRGSEPSVVSWSQAVDRPGVDEPSEIMVAIDVMSDAFTMSKLKLNSHALQNLGLPGLMSLLPDSSADTFADWVQTRVNYALHGMTPAPSEVDAGPLVLKLGEELHITVDSTLISFPYDFDLEPPAHAVLKLRGLSRISPGRDLHEAQDTSIKFEICL